jgi:tetratricopeptide (TPR) repeat protein
MNLERIEVTPFTAIVREIVAEKRTGYLTLARESLRRTLYWAFGELVLVLSSNPKESLWAFLAFKGIIPPEKAMELAGIDPIDTIPRFQSLPIPDPDTRRSIEREWLRALTLPLFSLEAGTAVFADAEAIPPERRILIPSTPALIIEGIRSISNGLVLRRSLGDMSATIGLRDDPVVPLERLPLLESEMKIAHTLEAPVAVEGFLKRFGAESTAAAKVVVMLTTLGVWGEVERPRPNVMVQGNDVALEEDLALLAAIGSSDPRTLKAVALSRRVDKISLYELIDEPKAAPTARIVEKIERLKKDYDPSTFPAAARSAIERIQSGFDRAMKTLSSPLFRPQYDKLLQQGGAEGKTVEQEQARYRVSHQNYERAKELSILGDYYGAIVLLKQAVQFDTTRAEVWHLLGSCQERNPKWRRDAAISFQKALAADANHVDSLIALGDLYKSEGLTTRAQALYEDVLAIQPDHPEAQSRLKSVKGR